MSFLTLKTVEQVTRSRQAFAIIEILIAIIILGILAAIALPDYSKSIEKSRGKNGEVNLISIYNAQKRYRLDNGNYYTCAPCNPSTINSALDVHIDDPYFTYEIKSESGSGYRVIARRISQGICGNKTMQLTDAGSNITKGCIVW